MGFAEFLAKRFIGQEVCVSINDGESETICLEQTWRWNREYFMGTVKKIEEGIIILEICGEGEIYINPDQISYIWQKPLNPHKTMRTALTKKPSKIGSDL